MYHEEMRFMISAIHVSQKQTLKQLTSKELYTIAPYMFHPNFYVPHMCGYVLAKYSVYNLHDLPDVTMYIVDTMLKAWVTNYITENWIPGDIKHQQPYIRDTIVNFYCLMCNSSLIILPPELLNLIKNFYIQMVLPPFTPS